MIYPFSVPLEFAQQIEVRLLRDVFHQNRITGKRTIKAGETITLIWLGAPKFTQGIRGLSDLDQTATEGIDFEFIDGVSPSNAFGRKN